MFKTVNTNQASSVFFCLGSCLLVLDSNQIIYFLFSFFFAPFAVKKERSNLFSKTQP